MTTIWSRRIAGLLLVALLALFFAYPLLRFLALPFATASASDHGWLNGLLVAVRNTALLALGAACIAAPLGAAIAWLLERRASPLNHAMTSALWLIFLAPSYLLTTGWQIVFREPGLRHGLAAALFFSPFGIVALLALKALPFCAFVVRPTWAGMGRELEEAMRVHALSLARRAGLTLRLALPAAAAGFVIAFIESVQEFGIPATLGAHLRMPILTYAIYEHLSTSPLDFAGAARLSWVVVAMAAGGALLHLSLHHRHSAVLVHGRARHAAPPPPGRVLHGAILLLAGVLWGLGLLTPGFALVASALAGHDWAGDYASLFNSTGFAVLAATASLALAVTLARASNRSGQGLAVGIELFTLSNMAIPGLVLGAAYLMAFNTPWLPLYGTSLLLILGYTAGYAPMLTRLLQSPVAQIDRRLGEAARLHALPWAARVLDIEAVLLAAPLLRGWLLAFGFILFELPVSELLYPPGREPLGVAIVRLNQTLHFHAAARLALSGFALTAAVVALAGGVAYLLLPVGARRGTA
ncbi:ABC transporter permease [Acidihalobacter aeolianus]|uniref:ABC transporter permease n=1 Tax=Acidihalobacter aeolianus TaxID=2792603 RepID=UPI0009F231DD|nr:ABC transporter permease subunit [Acidihalobacter aeolianus]